MTQIFGLSGAAPAVAGDGAVAKTGFNQTLSTSHLSSLNSNYFDIDLLNSPIRSKEILSKHGISSVKFTICSVKSYTEAAFLFILIPKSALNGAFRQFCLIHSSTFSQCQTWKINNSQFDARLKPALYLLNVTCN